MRRRPAIIRTNNVELQCCYYLRTYCYQMITYDTAVIIKFVNWRANTTVFWKKHRDFETTNVGGGQVGARRREYGNRWDGKWPTNARVDRMSDLYVGYHPVVVLGSKAKLFPYSDFLFSVLGRPSVLSTLFVRRSPIVVVVPSCHRRRRGLRILNGTRLRWRLNDSKEVIIVFRQYTRRYSSRK